MDRPVNIDRHLQLKGHNVNLSLMSFGSVTMQSDKFIACSLTTRVSKRYSIFDLADVVHPLNLPISPDSIIVNPIRREIIATQTGQKLQIYNTESGQYVKEHSHHDSILFWKWIDVKTIAIITQNTAVFHWNSDGLFQHDGEPLMIFSVEQKIRERCRIVYCVGRFHNTIYTNLSRFPYSMECGHDTHIFMHASLKQGLLFILTKFGYIRIFDIETRSEVYNARIMDDTICLTTEYSKGGVMGITRRGLVFSVSINERAMIDHISQSNPDLARRLSERWNVGVPPRAPPLDLTDQVEMGEPRRRRITTDTDPYPLTDTIKDILRAAGQDPSKMRKKEIKFVYDFIGKYQEDWIASEIDTPLYEILPQKSDDPHPSEPVHPPIPAPRPSLAKTNNQVYQTDWKARAEKAEKEQDDLTRKYLKLLMMMGRTERK